MKQALSLGLVLATIVFFAWPHTPEAVPPPPAEEITRDDVCAKGHDWIHDSYSDRDCGRFLTRAKILERQGDVEGLEKLRKEASVPGSFLGDDDHWRENY